MKCDVLLFFATDGQMSLSSSCLTIRMVTHNFFAVIIRVAIPTLLLHYLHAGSQYDLPPGNAGSRLENAGIILGECCCPFSGVAVFYDTHGKRWGMVGATQPISYPKPFVFSNIPVDKNWVHFLFRFRKSAFVI